MAYSLISAVSGTPEIDELVPATAPTGIFNPWPPIPLGAKICALDPVWGPAEFIFVKFGGSVRQFGLCVITPTLNTTTRQYEPVATEVPNTANLARPVYVAQCSGAASANQFGWVMFAGLTPINGTASVAAAVPVGITAAGQVGASSAGKELQGATSILAATNTVVKASVAGAHGQTGQNTIQLANVDGLFVGGYVAGTGVGAANFITGIDPINNVITVNVVNSALVTGNVTQTANNATIFYNVCQLESASAQGRIT